MCHLGDTNYVTLAGNLCIVLLIFSDGHQPAGELHHLFADLWRHRQQGLDGVLLLSEHKETLLAWNKIVRTRYNQCHKVKFNVNKSLLLKLAFFLFKNNDIIIWNPCDNTFPEIPILASLTKLWSSEQ